MTIISGTIISFSNIENSALQHGLQGCLIPFTPLLSYLSSILDQELAFTTVGHIFITYLTPPYIYQCPSQILVKYDNKQLRVTTQYLIYIDFHHLLTLRPVITITLAPTVLPRLLHDVSRAFIYPTN